MRVLWQSFTAPGSEYMQALQENLQSLARPGTVVEVAGIEPSGSHVHRLSQLRCAYQVVAQNLDAAERGYDAVVIGHFQDGGLHELRSALAVPVVGLGEAAMHQAMMLGDGFGLVAIHPGHLPTHIQQVRTYRLGSKFVGVRAMDTDPPTYLAAFEGDDAATRRAIDQFEQRARELVEAGADVVIPAGGLPALLLWRVSGLPDLNGATVLDPIGAALGQAELWAHMGPSRVSPGRRGSFAVPAPEVLAELTGLLDHH